MIPRGKQINRLAVSIILLLISLCCTSICLPARVEAASSVAPEQIKFVFETRPTTDIPADKTITIREKGKGQEQASEPLFYYCTELAEEASNYTISPMHVLAKTPYDSDYKSLDQDLLFLGTGGSYSEVQFKLAKEAWGPKGVYKGWLRCSAGRDKDIRVVVHIKAHTALILDGGSFTVTATNGPGVYEAKETANIMVDSNHRNWLLTLGLDGPLVYQGEAESNPMIEPENLYLSINGEDYIPLTEQQVISGDECGRQAEISVNLKAKTSWQHLAGSYAGIISLTLTESLQGTQWGLH